MLGLRPIANMTRSASSRRAVATSVRGIAIVRRFSIAVDGVAGDDFDAARLHLAAQMLAHVVVEAAQDVLAAIDQRHLDAQPGENAGELHRDIAAALDHDAAGSAADETPRSM